MSIVPPSIIIRHRKENLRKCSLSPLEGRDDLLFVRYPDCLLGNQLPPLEGYILLDIDGEELSAADTAPLVLLDATWKYAAIMRKTIRQLERCVFRKLPEGWRTAYPRYQTGCSDPLWGLASVEALYAAYTTTGRSTKGLLDNYYWNELFEKNNADFLAR